MIYLPLISIIAIYFLVALVKPIVQPKLPFNLCAVCVSVSLTWFVILILWLIGYNIPLIMIGILMGMSITGIMYKAENLYKKLQIKNFWFVRLAIVIGGFYGVYSFLLKDWPVFILISIGLILLIVIPTFFFQKITHAEALKEVKNENTIIQKLDNCC